MPTAPEIPETMKTALKNERLQQYKSRIFQGQMDLAAAVAVNANTQIVEGIEKNIENLVISYYAVEAM